MLPQARYVLNKVSLVLRKIIVLRKSTTPLIVRGSFEDDNETLHNNTKIT